VSIASPQTLASSLSTPFVHGCARKKDAMPSDLDRMAAYRFARLDPGQAVRSGPAQVGFSSGPHDFGHE
jgi:hypothetical protein